VNERRSSVSYKYALLPASDDGSSPMPLLLKFGAMTRPNLLVTFPIPPLTHHACSACSIILT
jgi:hypothetical protein